MLSRSAAWLAPEIVGSNERARSVASENGVLLDPVRGQESHMIARAAAADALVLAPRGEGELAAGERVRYLPLA